MADLSAATFISVYPEFSEAYQVVPAMVQYALDNAQAQVDATRSGPLYTQLVHLLAAHTLALSPHGENLRLKSDQTSSPYWVRYQQLLNTRPLIRFGLACP